MSTVDILETRIDRAIKELLDIDMNLARSTGNVSVGFSQLKEMSQTLKANAHKAVHAPTVTNQQRTIHDMICSKGWSIKNTANHFGISQSTVRRALDKVTENDCLVARS